MGHVGHELARILTRHDLDLHLVDSRAERVDPSAMPWSTDAVARVHVHHAPLPEMVLDELPPGTRVLVMTHDHAEDYALCDAALRCSRLGSVGLIGSSAKWSRFRQRLAAEGHAAEVVARIQSPIGVGDLRGKEPATIALAVAADLLRETTPDRASLDVRP
jgi:xanthine dehydrogenase accessory factor